MINITSGIYKLNEPKQKYVQQKRLTTGAHKIRPKVRHASLVELVTGKMMTPVEISERLKISVITIRRDILDLLDEGRIIDTSESRERLVTAS